ncbi:MAG: sigma-70 family RNA polymerase sigma factor [Anaeromyxobacter sp.]
MADEALDLEVRRLLGAGERDAAATLALRRLGPKVVGYLRTVLRNEADAAEAFGVFAEHLWRGLEGWRGEAPLRGWAFRLAWNAALNLRNEAWRRRVRRMETGEASRIAEEVRTATALRVERQRRGLDKLREALSPEEQTLLSLRVDQELSWSEIAAVLAPEQGEVDPAALRKRFERMKARLGELARAQGLMEE